MSLLRVISDFFHNLFSRSKKIKRTPEKKLVKPKNISKKQDEAIQKNLKSSPLLKIPKGSKKQLSKYFNSSEFDCKCSFETCTTTLIDKRMIVRLEEVRRAWGRPLHITSAYRCEEHNKNIGGVPKSRHIKGLAVDLAVTGTDDSKKKLNDLLSTRFPFVLRYPKRNFTHVDLREYEPHLKYLIDSDKHRKA